MNDSLLILILGGIIAILSSVVTYYINHALRLKEQSISREFTMRKEASAFFQSLYGSISRLADYVRSCIEPEGDTILIRSEDGYKEVSKEEVIKEFRESYRKSSKIWSRAVEEGYEIFLPSELAKTLGAFWALASFLNGLDDWEGIKEHLSAFDMLSERALDMIEVSLALKKREVSKRPKWLNWKSIRSTIRGK